jgi:chromosome segregation ATPase
MGDTDSSESEPTQKLTPFQTMVLARFDQIDARFDQIDERLDKLEAKALDTKPIWQQALAEILEMKGELVYVGKRLDKLERGMRVLNDSILEVRADLRGHDDRITALEPKPTQ